MEELDPAICNALQTKDVPPDIFHTFVYSLVTGRVSPHLFLTKKNADYLQQIVNDITVYKIKQLEQKDIIKNLKKICKKLDGTIQVYGKVCSSDSNDKIICSGILQLTIPSNWCYVEEHNIRLGVYFLQEIITYFKKENDPLLLTEDHSMDTIIFRSPFSRNQIVSNSEQKFCQNINRLLHHLRYLGHTPEVTIKSGSYKNLSKSLRNELEKEANWKATHHSKWKGCYLDFHNYRIVCEQEQKVHDSYGKKCFCKGWLNDFYSVIQTLRYGTDYYATLHITGFDLI